MNCEAIRPVIRKFLDDLLDERDYQDVQTHLGGCDRCHVYAASLGTLSYRLYELGQVPVPPGMSSMILYGLEKKRQDTSVAPASSTEKVTVVMRLFWAAIFLIVAAVVVIIVAIMSLHQSQKVDKVVVTKLASAPVLVEKNQTEAQTYWHYHVSSSGKDELDHIFQDLGLTALDDSPGQLVFDVPKEKLEDFTGRMAELSGEVKEYGEIDLSGVDAGVVRVSIYLE